MTTKPELVKVSETEYRCSGGDWRWELSQPNTLMQVVMEQRFAEHVRLAHSGDRDAEKD
jgi:hypothetical protein